VNRALNEQNLQSLYQAKADVFGHIEIFYNRIRRHTHLGGVSPEVFEQASV
jgi:putative transposase